MSCPKWAAFSHAWYWSKGKEATYHNDILVASIHSCKQQPIYCIVCIRVCLIPYIWFLIRILDFGKCNPYGTAKGGERFAKDLRKGGSWELLFSTTRRILKICVWRPCTSTRVSKIILWFWAQTPHAVSFAAWPPPQNHFSKLDEIDFEGPLPITT